MVKLEYGDWLMYVINDKGTHDDFVKHVSWLKKCLMEDELMDENDFLIIENNQALYKFYANYLNYFHKGIALFISGVMAVLDGHSISKDIL